MNFSEHLAEYGITRLFYLTSLGNLESILERGILCRQAATKYQPEDISWDYVQRHRRKYHSYVPLFFADNTPMLYVCTAVSRDNRDDVILLEVAPGVANGDHVKFSDGNIAMTGSSEYTASADLANLDWRIISRRSPAYGVDRHGNDWGRIRSAEVLIPEICPAAHIRGVYFQSRLVDGQSKIKRVISDSPQTHSIFVKNCLIPEGIDE